jgi:hypothetical protein
MVVTATMVVTANLTLAADVMGTDTEAAFKAKILPTIASISGVGEAAVVIVSVVKTTARHHRRGLLAAAVNVEVEVSFNVDGTAGARNVATDKAVSFMTRARYMTSALLPPTMANTANVGVTTLAAPASVGLTCPPTKTYADAADMVGKEPPEILAARRVLNDLAICAHKDGTGLDEASMANNYNLLGFTTRKLAVPDRVLSELYYKRALQINPSHVAASGYLGELYVDMKRVGESPL